MLELEGDVHKRLRGLVLRAFTSRRIAALGPEIAKLSHDLIDQFDGENFDFIKEFAEPLPVTIIARLLGVPEENAPELLAWSHAIVGMYKASRTRKDEMAASKAGFEFAAFLVKYPNSGFAGNAQYWLGEAHYVTRNFEQGIVEFEKVLNSFPGSNKVPDAMLKLGYTYYELKQYPQAKTILQELRTRFPDETAARLATKRLDRIRKEGH